MESALKDLRSDELGKLEIFLQSLLTEKQIDELVAHDGTHKERRIKRIRDLREKIVESYGIGSPFIRSNMGFYKMGTMSANGKDRLKKMLVVRAEELAHIEKRVADRLAATEGGPTNPEF